MLNIYTNESVTVYFALDKFGNYDCNALRNTPEDTDFGFIEIEDGRIVNVNGADDIGADEQEKFADQFSIRFVDATIVSKYNV